MVKQKKGHQNKLKMRGQSLVEFALVLPLLLLLILGAIDFGRLFHAQIVITNAAREGAYYLLSHPDDGAAVVATAQQEAANSGIDAVTVEVGNCESLEDCKKVTVRTEVSNLTLLDFTSLRERQASVEMRVQP